MEFSRVSLSTAASRWENDRTERTVNSLYSIFVLLDEYMHVCVCAMGRGGNRGVVLAWASQWNKNQCCNWRAPPDEAIWESQPQRSRRGWPMTMTSEPRAQQQTRSCCSKNKGCLFAGSFFLFQDPSCELRMWRRSTLTFVSLVTDSLCRSSKYWRGRGGGAQSSLWCWVLITWEAEITKQPDLHTVMWVRSLNTWTNTDSWSSK